MALVGVARMAYGIDSAGPLALEWGIRTGVNLATVSGTDIRATHPGLMAIKGMTGLAGGVFMSIGDGTMAFAPELLLTAKGYRATGALGGSALAITDRATYVEIPLLLKIILIAEGSVRPYVSAGPGIAFLTSATSTEDLSGHVTTTDAGRAWSSYDYSVVAALGISWLVKPVILSAALRYNLGLMDVASSNDVILKNNVMSFMAGCSW